MLVFSSSCTVLNRPAVNDTAETAILKSPLDLRDYKIVILPNQMEVLLISDPTTDKAAAALDVRVGQFDDPKDRQGLAHFLEHMLFLGSKKFPAADDFGKFLSAHGGYSNAYTSLDDSNFFFTIHKDYLEGALDRFSQFFIAPRFGPLLVERETNAVDSEHQKNIKNDARRIYQILRDTSNPQHPFQQFGTGNLETLRKDEVDPKILHDQLTGFYRDHYSSNLMKLVILGKEPVAELEKLTRKFFTAVKNKHRVPKSYSGISVIDSKLPRKINIQPIKVSRKLRLMFPIPAQRKYYQTKPGQLIGHLLGDESAGSILSFLKNRGWATSLSAGIGTGNNDFAFFGVSISLTPEGLKHVDEIATVVFQYINLISQNKDLKRYFSELKKIAKIDFQYHEKEDPYGYVSRLAAKLQDIPYQHVIASRWLYEEYKPELVANLLKYLVPDNLQIVLVSPEAATNRVEKWYEARYSIEPVTGNIIDKWRNPLANANLSLPAPNPFIADKVVLKPKTSLESVPVLLKNSGGVSFWFKQDDMFEVPKGNIRFQLTSPKAYSSVRNAAMTQLFTMLLRENLNEYTYPAFLAGLSYSITNSVKGLELSLSGYSENIELLFRKIVDSMVNFKVSREKFEIFRNQIKESRQNQKLGQAFHRVGYEMYYLLSETLWHTDEYIAVIDQISISDLEIFVKELLAQLRVEFFSHGNFSQEESFRLVEILETDFIKPSQPVPDIIRTRTLVVPNGKPLTYQLKVEDVNSAVQVYYQAGPSKTRQTVTLDMIAQLLEKPLYHQLRTIEQLGYIVWSGYRLINKVEGFYFIIQSSSKDPVYLQERIEKFLADFVLTLDQISPTEFEKFKEALIAKRQEQPKTLQEATQRYWSVISSRSYDFNHLEAEIKELKTLELEEVRRAYQALFLSKPQTKKISVQAVGQKHKLILPVDQLIKDSKSFKTEMQFYHNPDGKIAKSLNPAIIKN